MSDLSVTLLGTGTPYPNPERASASYLFRAVDFSFMIDCGPVVLLHLGQAGSSPHAAGRQRCPQLSYPSRQPVNHCPLRPHGSTPGRREGEATIEVTTRPNAGKETALKLLKGIAKMQ